MSLVTFTCILFIWFWLCGAVGVIVFNKAELELTPKGTQFWLSVLVFFTWPAFAF